jgi:hypothetical protein
MAEPKKEYYLCPFGDTSKPRMCPAKHAEAGWKCPLERNGECAVNQIAEHLQRVRAGY